MPVKCPLGRDAIQCSVLCCLYSVHDDGGDKDLGRLPVLSSLKSQLPRKSAIFLSVSSKPVIIMGLSIHHTALFCKSLTIAFH